MFSHIIAFPSYCADGFFCCAEAFLIWSSFDGLFFLLFPLPKEIGKNITAYILF